MNPCASPELGRSICLALSREALAGPALRRMLVVRCFHFDFLLCVSVIFVCIDCALEGRPRIIGRFHMSIARNELALKTHDRTLTVSQNIRMYRYLCGGRAAVSVSARCRLSGG